MTQRTNSCTKQNPNQGMKNKAFEEMVVQRGGCASNTLADNLATESAGSALHCYKEIKENLQTMGLKVLK